MYGCETLKVERVVGEKTKQAVVQDVFRLPEPKPCIEKVISIDRTVKVTKIEVIEDKVIVEGHLNLQIVYVADLPGVHAVRRNTRCRAGDDGAGKGDG
jgi:hypothetical protein